jgi:hypothetical protein
MAANRLENILPPTLSPWTLAIKMSDEVWSKKWGRKKTKRLRTLHTIPESEN